MNPETEAHVKQPGLASEEFYPTPINIIRSVEYPHMTEGVYLDHSGATIYAKSLIDAFAEQMSSNLYGNPHSANRPAERSGNVVDEVREKTLRFLGADPEHFDLVFVANATAGIKLVADSLRDLAENTQSGDFWYGYHKDSHTSLVGVRELTYGHSHCFESDAEVERWLDDPEGQLEQAKKEDLINFHGTMGWVFLLIQHSPIYFSCVSLYKIFGFPDLGALIVRKASGHVLTLRRYFGGGTVTMVSVLGGTWHKIKGRDVVLNPAMRGLRQDDDGHPYEIHDSLEDGTLPFHSILALGEAINVHLRLYGPMSNVSRHTTCLSKQFYQRLKSLTHANGRPLCHIYTEDDGRGFGNPRKQGATIAFNLLDSSGYYIPYSDVERISNDNRIFLRSGGVCCPGGLFTALSYEPWQLQRAFSAHHTCGPDGISLIHQLPTGIVRASLGAMSTRDDLDIFISFLQKTFVDQGIGRTTKSTKKLDKVVRRTNKDRGSEDTLVSVAFI
ncbi:hypothetical protein N0V93_001359 [Gnomoniopsis smithogilvyi]|uniref:Aminotransferase class V domain-containing protein n=1 Tax=Gnomoniopsis smithogilvyi TaxID=1191159 RepID=A0A9W8Z3T7_9PEZI|nr:hypothetical protein N0V93_001359 [Gnomoniopsis smithogilvyi]